MSELGHKEDWALETWCFWTVELEKTLESPLDIKKIKPFNPENLLEGLMLKLKLQYFGHLIFRANPLENTLMVIKIENRGEGSGRGWDGWMSSWTQWKWVSANSGREWKTGKPDIHKKMYVTEQVNNNDNFWNSSKKLQRKKHSQPHSIRPSSFWYQNQPKISYTHTPKNKTKQYKTIGQYHW